MPRRQTYSPRQNNAPGGGYYGDTETEPGSVPSEFSYGGTQTEPGRGVNPYDLGGPGSYGGFDPTTGDPYEQMKQSRNWTYDRGNAINQGIYNDIGYRRGQEQQYGGYMNTAAQNLWETPGYTPDEAAGIMRADDLNNLGNIDYGSNYLTPDEQTAIAGNPYASQDYYNPSALEGVNRNAEQNSAQALANQGNAFNENLANTRQGMSAAISPNLNMSDEYTRNQDAVLNSTANRVNSAADSADLQTSGEYGKQAGMTDAEVQQTVDRAGRNVGNRYRSAVGDLARNAAASGNAGPLAVAAARNRLERGSAVDSADAMADAYLDARAQQRQAATGVEQTRLSAARDISNRGMQAGFGLGEMGNQAVQNREQTRLGASRDVSNRQMDVAQTTGQMGQQAAAIQGQASQNAIQQNANRAQQTGQYAQTTGIGMARANEGEAASRAAYLGGNRQNVNQANQTNQFNRGFQVNNTMSGRTADVANQRIAGRNTYLGWASGQTNQNAQLGTQSRGQQVQNYGTQAGAMNQGNSIYGNYDLARRGQGFGTSFKQGFGSSLGNFMGNPARTLKPNGMN